MLYFDTNVFHYLREALAGHELPQEVRNKIVLSPISAIEVLSQLTARESEKIFASIQTMRTWLPERAGILDWPTTFISWAIFRKRVQDVLFDIISDAINACWAAESAQDLEVPAADLRRLLDEAKLAQAKENQAILEKYRMNPAGEEELKAAFIQGVSQRVGLTADQGPGHQDFLESLSAYFEFQTVILMKAAGNKKYNFLSPDHQNDALDAEQLVYLADQNLHFLTCDTGYDSIKTSKQSTRILIVDPDELRDPARAVQVLESIG